MRRNLLIYTDLDPFTGQTILSATESDTTQGKWWIGMRTKEDLITNVNIAMQGNVGWPNSLVLVFSMLPWNHGLFCNGNPDFSGYSQWEKLKRVS